MNDSKIDRRRHVIQFSMTSIFYVVSMTIIAASVLFFINYSQTRSQDVVDLIYQKNSLSTLQAKQALIRTQILKSIFFKDQNLQSEILSATEDYDFILNDFITVATKHQNIIDISLYNEVTASFSQLRELSYQLIRNIETNKVNEAINLFQREYTQRENIISSFINNAQYGKESNINSLNEEISKSKLFFTYVFSIEIIMTLIITYLINWKVSNSLLKTAATLRKLASRDALTGLYNRRLFLERLEYSIELTKSNGQKFILFFIDLDGFKAINDIQGHSVGDKILIEVSQRIQDSVRETDAVYRLGGDEFTVILECVNDTSDYDMLAKKLIEAISKPYYIENNDLFLSASIGISIYPEHGQSADLIINAADTAMYQVKSEKKNNYLCFSKTMLPETNTCS